MLQPLVLLRGPFSSDSPVGTHVNGVGDVAASEVAGEMLRAPNVVATMGCSRASFARHSRGDTTPRGVKESSIDHRTARNGREL
eukprot:6475997-Amphidinium_carterae.1